MTGADKAPVPHGGNEVEGTPVPEGLSPAYLRLVEIVESLPENQTGSDKTWVETLLRESREHFEKARRIR